MNYSERMVVSFVALAAFLASISVAVRGAFTYPVELGLLLLLGALLALSLFSPEKDASSAFLYVLFFTAVIANIAYLYSVAGYLSPARLIALALGVGGLVLSGYNMLRQPVPIQEGKAAGEVTSEIRKLMAAEKKLSDAKERLESVKVGKAVPKRKGRRRK